MNSLAQEIRTSSVPEEGFTRPTTINQSFVLAFQVVTILSNALDHLDSAFSEAWDILAKQHEAACKAHGFLFDVMWLGDRSMTGRRPR